MTESARQGSAGLGATLLPDHPDLLRRVIDEAAIGMALVDRDGRWIYANRALCALLGRRVEECIGATLADVIHPEDRPHLPGPLQPQDGVERRYRRADGSTFHALTSLSPLHGAADAQPQAILQIVDIEARRQAESALAESELRWRHALQGSHQVVWDFDVPSGMVWVSPQWQQLLDLPDEERVHPIGLWLDKMHPDDRGRLAEAVEQVRARGDTDFDAVYRLRHSAGRWLWVISRGRMIERAADGSVLRMIGTITDITREKEIEERLAALTERLEIALEAGGIGTYEVDFVAGVRRWDARTYQLHGITPENFDTSLDGFTRLLHPDDVARVVHIREAALRDGAEGYQADYRVQHAASGTLRHIRASIRLIRAADGRVLRGVGACWDITDHVDRTAQFRDTLALLQAVMRGTPDLIYAKDRDGRYLLANAAVETLMGRPAAEIIGRRDSEIFTPEIAAPLMENDRRVLERGEPYTVEEVAYNGDVLHTFSSTKAPQRDGRGQIIGTLGISRDVTGMKAAEAALRQSELRWAFALEGSGDGIWDWDLRSGHVFYSRQWKAMLGYDEADIGTTVDEWASRVHPDDLPRCWEIINRHASGATPDFVLEHRMRAKNGGWRWIHDRGRVIERGADGAPLRMIGTHTDTTVRRESEDAILALNQRLQLALEAARAGIFDLDFAVGRYHWDERMYGLYDLPLDGFDGTLQGWLRFILADDVPGVLREYETAVGETSVFSMDFRIRRQRSGQIRHIRSLARVIRDAAGAPLHIVGMNWDITDHRELAEALFEEKERLRITLHSIGDSVISTDAQCRIAFMNPVAEQMTGWSATEAAGRRLGEVFRIIDELSGEAIPDPVESCLAQMRPFYLSDGAILLGRDGERRSIRDSAAPVRTASGDVIGAVLVFQDVTKARVLQRALEHSASHDSLTGLRNRSAFEHGLREAREQALQAPHEQHQHVLCFIDLDRFKIVNDSAGHAAGDALLREVANLLRRLCRRQDLAARLGGDEFALLLRNCRIENGESIARQFLRSLGELRFVWNERSYRIGASMGLTQIGPAAPRIDELMSQADIACYAAKTAGRNQIAVYGDAGGAAHRHHREVQVAAGIRNAIENDRFRLFAQEVLNLAGTRGAKRHFEVLLRMLDDAGRIVEPAEFIPASERYDLMGNMDRWVIHTVLHGYGERLHAAQDLSIAINLSANSLNDPFLWPFLQEELSGSGLPPGRLHFEITETSVINNLTAAKQFLSKARAAGCGVVLDDFGTGLSSFTYLRQFPVSGLKIDGEFIRQMTHSEVDRAIVESINAIGHRLGAVTVAEQVEDEPTLQLVRAMGIDQAQGYAIARPCPLDSLF